jgi:transcriptional regulator with XRE-family HTH domain
VRVAVRKSRVKKKPSAPVPDIGRILKHLRAQRNVSIREVAEKSGLSATFVRAVERGDSDISLGRLARLAQFFDRDLGAFLGFSLRLSRPNVVGKESREHNFRGRGIDYESIHLPGIDVDLVLVEMAPRHRFRDELLHEGIDVLYVSAGEVVLELDHVEYALKAGDCVMYSAAYPHLLRNDSSKPASAFFINRKDILTRAEAKLRG